MRFLTAQQVDRLFDEAVAREMAGPDCVKEVKGPAAGAGLAPCASGKTAALEAPPQASA
jgi:hypothetical protein